MRKETKLLMAFWSPIYHEGGKSGRLNGYLDEFEKHKNIRIFYFGHPEKKDILKNKHSILTSYCGSRFILALSSLIQKLASPLGYSSFARHMGTKILSYRIIYSKQFKQSNCVFTQSNFLPLVKAAKKRGLPVILEADADHPLSLWNRVRERERINHISRRDADPINYWPAVSQAIKALEIADNIIVFSTHAENTFIENGINKEKLYKLRPPLSKRMFGSGTISKHPKFLFVSNHAVRKGLDIILEAWKIYKENGGRGTLCLLGKQSPAFKSIYNRYQSLHSVELKGRVNLNEMLTEEIGVLLLPSFSEGRPRVVLEAMDAGYPVVVSSAAMSDIVRNEYNGFLIPPDSKKLSKKLGEIDEMWENKILEIGRNASRAIDYELEYNTYYEDVYNIISNCGDELH